MDSSQIRDENRDDRLPRPRRLALRLDSQHDPQARTADEIRHAVIR